MPKLTDEQIDLKRASQDIILFLRLADLRVENKDTQPFPAKTAHGVIAWLRALAVCYGDGEDISE